jgi:hypothetical protein
MRGPERDEHGHWRIPIRNDNLIATSDFFDILADIVFDCGYVGLNHFSIMTQYFGLSTNFSPKFLSLGWKKKNRRVSPEMPLGVGRIEDAVHNPTLDLLKSESVGASK